MSTPLPTSVVDDRHASADELLARAAVDYRAAQRRHDQLCNEERVHGHEPEREPEPER